ncbi:MAG: hypothetical protein NTV31_11825 [Bacteroidia bacterium]|nr:hypothetical protein [Bacteroidia bacterium]
MTERENIAFIAGFCFLMVILVSVAACTTSNSGTNNSVTIPDNPTTADNQQLLGPVV